MLFIVFYPFGFKGENSTFIQFLQQELTRLEFDACAGSDYTLFAGTGISAFTLGLLPEGEDAETLKSDRVAFFQRGGENVQTCFDNFLDESWVNSRREASLFLNSALFMFCEIDSC